MESTNLIVMTSSEIETFLVDGRCQYLQSLIAPCRIVNPEEIDEGSWELVLREANPEILVAGWKTPPLPPDVRQTQAPALRYVCYLPGSVRKLVPRKLIEEGVLVTNWSSSISRTVAECALLLGLACMRRLSYWAEEMHNQGGWKNGATVTQSLFDRRVGLHGFGSVAKMLVRLLQPFTKQIAAYTEGVSVSVYEEYGVKRCESLKELFANSDVVFEVEALTPERVGIIDETLLRSMPEGSTFVNVARGALVDEAALLKVAQEGRVQVGLDVYAIEPLPRDHPFRGCRNMVLLPHLGGPSTDRRRDAADHGMENLRRYLEGKPLLNPIDASIYDRST